MGKPIYTNNGVIDTNMELVDYVIGRMEENLGELMRLKNDLVNGSQGDGMEAFAIQAKDLETRLNNYSDAIKQLRGATHEARQLIANADADVSRMFQHWV